MKKEAPSFISTIQPRLMDDGDTFGLEISLTNGRKERLMCKTEHLAQWVTLLLIIGQEALDVLDEESLERMRAFSEGVKTRFPVQKIELDFDSVPETPVMVVRLGTLDLKLDLEPQQIAYLREMLLLRA